MYHTFCLGPLQNASESSICEKTSSENINFDDKFANASQILKPTSPDREREHRFCHEAQAGASILTKSVRHHHRFWNQPFQNASRTLRSAQERPREPKRAQESPGALRRELATQCPLTAHHMYSETKIQSVCIDESRKRAHSLYNCECGCIIILKHKRHYNTWPLHI